MSPVKSPKNNASVSYVRSGNSLSVRLGSKLYVIDKSNANYTVVLKELKKSNAKRDIKKLRRLVSIKSALRSYTHGLIKIRKGVLTYNNKVLNDSLSERILSLFKSGDDFKPFVLFLENVRKNPTKWAKETVFDFLRSKNMPLTRDGCFIAYKTIQNNWTDWYTGTKLNTIGKTLKIRRKDVEENTLKDCGFGFHVGNLQYVNSFHSGEGRIILVKIDPRYVVSVPSDAAANKIRVCQYTIIKEYDGKLITSEIYCE